MYIFFIFSFLRGGEGGVDGDFFEALVIKYIIILGCVFSFSKPQCL
jgi:hypothetical protein